MTKESILLVISCLGIVQALFLCFYLLTLKKGNKKANIFLILVLLGLTLRIGKSILNVYLDLSPWQRNLGISGILIVGPALWYHGRLLLLKPKVLLHKSYLHFLPFALFAAFCVVIPNNGRPIAYVIYILVFLHLAVYLAFSISVLLRNKKNVHVQLFKWYRNLLLGVGLIWMFYMGNVLGFIPWYIGGAIFFSFLIYTFSFLFLQRHDLALEKYGSSRLNVPASKQLIHLLKELFDREELFLDHTISLPKISKKMNCSPRDISRAINENEGRNFSDFVNQYRVQKAKLLLSTPEYRNEKVATIAYDCGFGNVTSFNLAFKAQTQLTPSQYRDRFNVV